MRRLMVLLALSALVWPAIAAGKEGAMFNPQLLGLISGESNREAFFVLPVVRGNRMIVPAPRVGAVPVVTLRLLGRRTALRFVGTPIDRNLGSVVWIRLPPSRVSQQWVISVRAGGHLYPDVIDRPVTSMPAPSAPAAVLPAPAATRHPGGDQAWPLLLAGAALAAAGGAWVLRRARRGPRVARNA